MSARSDGFKNLNDLKNAFLDLKKQNKNIRLFLAVDPIEQETFRKRLLSTIPSKWADSIFISPSINHSGMQEVFKLAKGKSVFVFPSIYETFGITPLQAQKHGIPVIAEDEPVKIGCRSYLDNAYLYKNGYEGMLKKIEDVLEVGTHKDGKLLSKQSLPLDSDIYLNLDEILNWLAEFYNSNEASEKLLNAS